LRLMMSLDPITEGGFGYPLLFQTGETWHGVPLHDRQHPHDLFDELSVTYSRLLSKDTSGYLYFGDPGEPALGPPTYMHRLIAYYLPEAPIGHHWQDATHITFGVATAGINFNSRVKLEGSVFTGREPDENRYDFDPASFDSYGGRLSFNPDVRNTLQLSYGFIRNPEGDGISQHRITASWAYNHPLGNDANFTTTLSWGQNLLPTEGTTSSYLLEAVYQRGRNAVFGRIENITKSGHDLVLPEALNANKYALGAYTIGYIHDLTHGSGIDAGIGGAVTFNTKPSSLDTFYGPGTPVSFEIFLRLRPSRMGGYMSHEETNTEPTGATAEATQGVRIALTTQPEQPVAGQKTSLVVQLTDRDGKPITGGKIRADVEMTSMSMGVEHPAFTEMGEGRYQGSMPFAMNGPWRVTLTITVPGSIKPFKLSIDIQVH